MEHIYQVKTDWTSGRKGLVSSAALNDKIEVATPPEFSGGVPGVWSPEHLLVAAVNSCLMTTFLAIAENSKLDYVSFSSKGTGKLEKTESGLMITEVLLEPLVEVKDEKDRLRAERVLQKSEANCLISNSLKSKIVLKPFVKVLNLVAE